MPDYQEFIQAWREREQAEAVQSLERKRKGLETAEKMAAILFEKYGVYEVYIFGSVVLPDKPFTKHSDIDIAVTGLSGADFFKAWRDIESIGDFRVDLHQVETCSEGFRKMIQSYGRRYIQDGSAPYCTIFIMGSRISVNESPMKLTEASRKGRIGTGGCWKA